MPINNILLVLCIGSILKQKNIFGVNGILFPEWYVLLIWKNNTSMDKYLGSFIKRKKTTGAKTV